MLRVLLLTVAACLGASGCTSRAPSSDQPPLSEQSPPSESTAPESPPPLAVATTRPARPWAHDHRGFAPDVHAGEQAFLADAAQATAFVGQVSPAETTPLVFSAKSEALCEIAEVIHGVPHGPLGVQLFGDPSRADPTCLAKLDPSYLSYTVGPRPDHAAQQRAFFALTRAVPRLRGLGYDGYGGTVHGEPALTREDLDDLEALAELQAVALSNVELSSVTAETLARVSGLRSLELEGSGATPELLRVVADGRAELLRFACDDCPLGDEGMAEIARFPRLQVLLLDSAKIGDAGMKHLAGLTELEILNLTRNTSITNAGVAHLAGLVHMRRLWLSTLAIDSGALPHLRRLTELELLHLDRTSVGDANFEVIAELTKLRELELWSTEVGNAGVSQLAGLQRLEKLGLEETKIDSDALQTLARLVELRELQLAGTSVADGLQQLGALTRLEYLDLGSTLIDDAALRRLPALPRLRTLDVSYSGVSDGVALARATDTLEVIIANDCSG